MKTIILFSASLFLCGASFAQTRVQNQTAAKEITAVKSTPGDIQAKNETSTSSTTTVQSNAVQQAETKAATSTEKGKTAVITQKNKAEASGKAAAKQVKKTVSQDISVSTSEQANMQVNAGDKDNKIDENASFNNQTNVSTTDAKAAGNQLKEEGKTKVKNTSDLAIENGTELKAEAGNTAIATGHTVKASSVKSAQTVKATVRTVKPNPVKIQGQVKAAGTVRIK